MSWHLEKLECVKTVRFAALTSIVSIETRTRVVQKDDHYFQSVKPITFEASLVKLKLALFLPNFFLLFFLPQEVKFQI